MNREDLENLAQGVGMVQAGINGSKLWTASTNQLGKMLEVVVNQVKQSASETMIRAIKKAVEYERAECAKIAEIAGMTSKDIARSIREREND